MDIQYYSSKVDRWIIIVLGLSLLFFISIFLWVGMEWYIVLIITIPLFGLMSLSITQIQYVIKGNKLGVKSTIRWRWYPIENISEVREIKNFLAAPAMSFTRVAIKFKRGTTTTAVPLEISPKDRDRFIADLLKINPNIKVIQ